MGGKGQKRREKNYRAAHGGNNRLPPPPNPSTVDAVPSKLRKIMAFTTGSGKETGSNERRNGGSGSGGGKCCLQKFNSKDKHESKSTGLREEGNPVSSLAAQDMDHGNEVSQNSANEKKKKTKKRKRIRDLRFEAVEESGVGSKRRERKKKRLEERKKKLKKARSKEVEDFPGREQIKFGDVVEAPPKLVAVPKALKTTQGASLERLRLRAIDAYRNRKGWTSRPGIDLLPPITTSSSF